MKTTPVPNVIFDVHLRNLKSTELKVLMVIIRQTLGWSDKKALHGRKILDWISSSQLQEKTGCSRHAISSAIDGLVNQKLIEVFDEKMELLREAFQRKGKQKLFFKVCSSQTMPVDKLGISSEYHNFSTPTNANFVHDLSKNISSLAQNMLYTKETSTKETLTK